MSSSAALLGIATGGVLLGNSFWSLLPNWQSEVSGSEVVRLEGPVSDSAFATVECNCQCPSQDSLPLIAGAFVAGCSTVVLLFCVIRCWRAQLAQHHEPEPRITRYYSAPIQAEARPAAVYSAPPQAETRPLALEDLVAKPRRAVVTPSTRRR